MRQGRYVAAAVAGAGAGRQRASPPQCWTDPATRVSDVVASSTHSTGVIMALPELAAFTAPWRSTSYASDHPSLSIERRFPPHVTMLSPFAKPDDDGALARLRRVVERHQVFDLVFTHAEQFGPGGAVWLVPEPADVVQWLLNDVLAAFPEYPPYDGLHLDPTPHLTVTAAGGAEVLAQVRAALTEGGPITARVSELGVWQRGDDDVWQPVATAPLGTSRS